MIIEDKLFSPYKVEFDGMCYTIYKESVVKSGLHEGVIKKDAVSYPTTLKGVINFFIRHKVGDVDITTTLTGFLKTYERNIKLFEKKFDEIMKDHDQS